MPHFPTRPSPNAQFATNNTIFSLFAFPNDPINIASLPNLNGWFIVTSTRVTTSLKHVPEGNPRPEALVFAYLAVPIMR